MRKLFYGLLLMSFAFSPVYLTSCSDDDDASPGSGGNGGNGGNGGGGGGGTEFGTFDLDVTGDYEVALNEGMAMFNDTIGNNYEELGFDSENDAMVHISIIAEHPTEEDNTVALGITIIQEGTNKIDVDVHEIVAFDSQFTPGAQIGLSVTNEDHFWSVGNEGIFEITAYGENSLKGEFINVVLENYMNDDKIYLNGTFEAFMTY
jgi:hypothetical protein